MEYSCVELNDLPDEILLIILKKLDNLEVLYSLQGVNERLNEIIRDPTCTSHLTFVKWSPKEFINKFSSNVIFDRVCLQILPEISMKIKWLDLESSSMKQILHSTDYPNLNGLGLYNVERETSRSLFTDEHLSSNMFKNQITTLIIAIDPNRSDLFTKANICKHIFTAFMKLTHLDVFSNRNEEQSKQELSIPGGESVVIIEDVGSATSSPTSKRMKPNDDDDDVLYNIEHMHDSKKQDNIFSNL
ncbi:unnamed protein product [Rotaria socialis]|uniref:F-box domain-containing protein n=1 Tax=Rotaria socialis TaxID=392032 RepID=A0A821CVE5_9BILA|nr:unnamed protein product [Rotaria socialis]